MGVEIRHLLLVLFALFLGLCGCGAGGGTEGGNPGGTPGGVVAPAGSESDAAPTIEPSPTPDPGSTLILNAETPNPEPTEENPDENF